MWPPPQQEPRWRRKDGQMVSIKTTADGRRQRSRKIIDEERKVLGQEWIYVKHLDGLERSDFCNFDKLRKHAYYKGKIEFNEQSKERGSRNKFVEKCGIPDRVKSFREVDSSENHPKARPGFAKPVGNGLRKE